MESQDKVVRIYADGVYDGFHRGHARQLQQAKRLFPKVHLIAGVCGQQDVLKFKGPTMFPGEQRAEMVQHCKWVDQVIYPAPWVVDQEFLNTHKIDYVAHDDIPYATQGHEDAYAVCKRLGKFKATKRTQGVSTTDVISNIIRDRERYMLRNLRRGQDRKNLNISWLQAVWLNIKESFCRRA